MHPRHSELNALEPTWGKGIASSLASPRASCPVHLKKNSYEIRIQKTGINLKQKYRLGRACTTNLKVEGGQG